MVWSGLVVLYEIYNLIQGLGPILIMYGLATFGLWFWLFQKVKRGSKLKSSDNDESAGGFPSSLHLHK